MKLTLRSILMIILNLILGIIVYLVETDKIVFFDSTIYNLLSPLICEGLTNFFKFVTNFANYITIIILCILSIIFIKNKWYGIIISVNAINSTIINKVLKAIFIRPRPDVLRLVEEGGYSFPSGHSMACACFYGILMYFIHKSNIKRKYKVILEILLIIIILLVGLSRIYLGVHYASDVLAGYLVSLIYLLIFTSLLEKLNYKKVS